MKTKQESIDHLLLDVHIKQRVKLSEIGDMLFWYFDTALNQKRKMLYVVH